MTTETPANFEGKPEMRSSCDKLSPSSNVSGDGVDGDGFAGGSGDGKDDYVLVNGSDVTSDDHGEIELNAGGGGGDWLGKCNCYSAKEVVEDNVVVVDGSEGVDVVEESEFPKKVKEVENGGDRVDNEGEVVVVKECNFEVIEDVVIEPETVIEGGECNGIVSPVLNYDDNGISKNNGCVVGEIEPQVPPSGAIEEHLMEDQFDEGEVRKLEVIEDNADQQIDEVGESKVIEDKADLFIDERKLEVIEDNVNDHIDEVGDLEVIEDIIKDHVDEVRKLEVNEDGVNLDVSDVLFAESEPMGGVVEETKPIEADVVDQCLENGDHIAVKTLDGVARPSVGGVDKVLLRHDVITEKQSTNCQPQDLQLADNGEIGAVEAEVSEQGGLDPLGMTKIQDLESLVSEATITIMDKDASDVKSEPKECLEPQGIVEQLAVVDGEKNRVLNISELNDLALESTDECAEPTSKLTQEVLGTLDKSTMDVQTNKFDKSIDEHELDMVHGEGKGEAIVQAERNLECFVQDEASPDQVVEDTGLDDVTDREFLSDGGISFNEVSTVDEIVKPAVFNWADDVVVDEENKDLDVCDQKDIVPDDVVNVPDSSHESRNSLKSESGDLTVSSSNQMDNDSDVVKPSSLANSKSHNDGIRNYVDDTQIEVNHVSDELTNKTCDSEYTIRFGSFMCQIKLNGVYTSLADVNAHIVTDGISTSSLEVSGVSITLSEVDAQIFTHGVSTSLLKEPGADSADEATIISNTEVKIVADMVSDTPLEEFNVEPAEGATSLSDVDAQIITDEVSVSPLEESEAKSFVETIEPARNVFRWMVKVPRLDNVEYEQINKLEVELAKKTRERDAFWKVHQGRMDVFREAKSKLYAARDEKEANAKLMAAKKREIESSQSLLKLARDGNTIERIDGQILSMERMIQHETPNLAEEKRLICEIKQLSNQRERLVAETQGQQEVYPAAGKKFEIEEQLKILRKEMDVLGGNYRTTLESLKVAERKLEEEAKLKHKLEAEYNALATTQEDTYSLLRTLKKQAYDKNKPCYDYKDARTAILNLKPGEEQSLEQLCVNQVENFMEQWNNNDKFRKEYAKSNMRSTLRRFNTLDDRDLGIYEKRPLLEDSSENGPISANVNSIASALTSEREFPLIVKKEKLEGSSKKVIEMKSMNAPAKNSGRTTSNNGLLEPSRRTETDKKEELAKLAKEQELTRKAEQKRREDDAECLKERKLEEKAKVQELTMKAEQKKREEEAERLKEQRKLKEKAKAHQELIRKAKEKRREEEAKCLKEQHKLEEKAKEQEELTRKAEQKRREEEAERLKEQRKLEEKAKAQEALERKRKMAEKAQARAKFKAEKEAEAKKKEKEKRAMKKGKKNSLTSETADVDPEVPEVTAKPVTVSKKSKKVAAYLYTKQIKATKSIPAPPAPLRNQGKRKIPQWVWWLVLAICIALIFPLGDIDFVGLLKHLLSRSF